MAVTIRPRRPNPLVLLLGHRRREGGPLDGNAAQVLARQFVTMDALLEADAEAFAAVHGIGAALGLTRGRVYDRLAVCRDRLRDSLIAALRRCRRSSHRSVRPAASRRNSTSPLRPCGESRWERNRKVEAVSELAEGLVASTWATLSTCWKIRRMADHQVRVGRPFPPMTGWNRLSFGRPEEMGRFADLLRSFRRQGWV